MNCLFCKICNQECKGKIIYEDDLFLAFLDIHPQKEGHTLLIPKNHYETFEEFDGNTWNQLKIAIESTTQKLTKIYQSKKITIKINYDFHKKCKHFHIHFIPES